VLSSFRRAKHTTSSIAKSTVEPTRNIQAKPATDIPLLTKSITSIQFLPSKAQENARHLLHFFSFCRSITTNHADWAVVESRWLDRLFQQIQAKDLHIVSTLFFPQSRQKNIRPSLLQLGLHVLLWFFEPATVLWCHSFFQNHAKAVLDTRCLHKVYNQWINTLTIALNAVLAPFHETLETVTLQLTTDTSPPSDSQAIGFRPFVTIMRESLMVRSHLRLVFSAVFHRQKTMQNLQKSCMPNWFGSPICQPSQHSIHQWHSSYHAWMSFDSSACVLGFTYVCYRAG
jgi:hypothetical protein